MDFDIRNLFYDWTTGGVITWLILSIGIIYVSWFVKIPSLIGNSTGMPFMVKAGLSIFIPVISWFLINNKEWTATKFGGAGRKR